LPALARGTKLFAPAPVHDGTTIKKSASVLAITFLAGRCGSIEPADRETTMSKILADARKLLNLDAAGGRGIRCEDPTTLSDWCLRDIGLTRFTRNFDAAKPFWMA
jgi:hypothetical protein